MQSTARKNELPLDKMSLTCEVSKKYPGESMQVPRDGAYVHGLFIEGARWVFFSNSNICYFSKKNGDKIQFTLTRIHCKSQFLLGGTSLLVQFVIQI